MKNYLIIYLLLCAHLGHAQDFPFGKVTPEDFSDTKIAPDANAITLQEYGFAGIEYSEAKRDLLLRHYYHSKILILKKEGFNEGNFSVHLHRSRSDREDIEGIKGITYKLKDGKIVKTELDKKNILTEKVSENRETVKIAFPDIEEGAIIELRYTTTSPYLYNFQSWQFQDFIPKKHSEFVTEIPEICQYNVNMRGIQPLTKRKAVPYDTRLTTSVGEVRGTKTTYIMENIPAFKKEEYMTSPYNFMARLTFELARYSIPFGPTHNFTTSWKDVEKQLHESENFGSELKRKNIFKDAFAEIISEEMNTLDKTKKVYEQIKEQIKWNKRNGLFTSQGIKKALEERNGNIAEVNLALVNALRSINIDANPVILSTRDNGYPSLIYPVLNDFNYVVAHVTIDDQTYLLDASEDNIPFGLIPLRCINLEGRLLNADKSEWIPLQANVTNHVSYNFNGDLDEKGSLKGTLYIFRNGYAALNQRNEVKTSNSIEEYFEKVAEKYPHLKISNPQLENLNELDNLLTETFTIEFENFANVQNNSLTMDPIFIGKTSKNPFNMDDRSFPVDIGSTLTQNYDINIKLPKGYKVVDKPKNLSLTLPNRDARYLYVVSEEEENNLKIQVISSLNKPFFMPEEYLHLKEFFSHIIQSQKVDYKIAKEI